MQINRKGSKLDPLDLLKEYVSGEKPIKQKEKYIYFEQMKFKLDTVTCFKAKKSKIQYSLGSLWLYLDQKKKKLNAREYSELCEKFGVQRVTKVDQEDVETYFTGKVDFTESIDLELKQQLMNSKKTDDRYHEGELPSKKIKTENGEGGAQGQQQNQEVSKEEECMNMMKWLAQAERPITSKTRLLRAPNKKFTQLLSYLSNLAQTGRQSQTFQQNPAALLPNCILREIYKTNKRPVIVVPQTNQAGNISLRNFKQLFQDGVYESPEKTQNRCYDGRLEVKHMINGRNITFEVVDNIGFLQNKNEWDRIVGLFMGGSKYQFSSWPNGDKTALFFTKIRGFYMHYSTFPPNDFVKSCNYKNLEVQESNRGHDKMIRDTFWKDLESFLLKTL